MHEVTMYSMSDMSAALGIEGHVSKAFVRVLHDEYAVIFPRGDTYYLRFVCPDYVGDFEHRIGDRDAMYRYLENTQGTWRKFSFT